VYAIRLICGIATKQDFLKVRLMLVCFEGHFDIPYVRKFWQINASEAFGRENFGESASS